MITREHLITLLRRELMKQQETGEIAVILSDTPDTFLVTGTLDLHALAEAILYATRWDK
jgi:hypothetical protein